MSTATRLLGSNDLKILDKLLQNTDEWTLSIVYESYCHYSDFVEYCSSKNVDIKTIYEKQLEMIEDDEDEDDFYDSPEIEAPKPITRDDKFIKDLAIDESSWINDSYDWDEDELPNMDGFFNVVKIYDDNAGIQNSSEEDYSMHVDVDELSIYNASCSKENVDGIQIEKDFEDRDDSDGFSDDESIERVNALRKLTRDRKREVTIRSRKKKSNVRTSSVFTRLRKKILSRAAYQLEKSASIAENQIILMDYDDVSSDFSSVPSSSLEMVKRRIVSDESDSDWDMRCNVPAMTSKTVLSVQRSMTQCFVSYIKENVQGVSVGVETLQNKDFVFFRSDVDTLTKLELILPSMLNELGDSVALRPPDPK